MWWARPNPKHEVAAFDSATAMLRALSRFLRGQDVPLLGELPPGAEPVMSAVMGAANRLPRRLAEKAYAASGWTEAMPVRRLGEVSSDALAEWITGHYPRRRHPVIFIGSTGGALTHLAAALDAPWLPQTLLLPVRRRGGHPDEPLAALEHGRPAAEALLAGNPDLVLHQMHDANQDRLMVAGMSYFRVKWTRLPPAYRRFIKDHLAPDGTVVIAECGQTWPTTRVGERHVFQHGGYGSLDPEEIQHGSPRVAEYLARYGSPYRKWDGPEPDGESPEAEWGFEPALLGDLLDLAHRTVRLRYDAPQDLSPAVADLYRAWYRRRGLPADRLLAECFVVMEPHWCLRTGSVPYWSVFNTEPARRGLLSYLDEVDKTDPYDEIRLMLFSHGVESAGLASIDDWREPLERARRIGTFTGVDTRAYPRDFACLARAHRELAQVRDLFPMPSPLPLADAEEHFTGRDDLDWTPQ
ncbi:hypothetical protein [Spirillospora sp. CA-294931]|uniref:hypothetical protein n=1 Tax=Spirillospora sp. CA-294931 TaxID=3240042 RepID=UPI003D8BB4D6